MASRSIRVVQACRALLTVGSVGDNVTGDTGNVRFPDANVRHMLLKSQVSPRARSTSTAAVICQRQC
jgi:hypothetical protein